MNDSIEIGLDTLKIEGDASKLFEALAKAQGEFVAVAKAATGQVGKDRKFKYADYNTLTKCVRPALTANGIALIQPLHSRDGKAVTTTIIAGHGAVITSSMAFSADPNPQEFGRHHTYYRRYQLQAMLGLAGDDDADEPPMAGVQYQEQASPPKEGKVSAAKPPAAAEPSKVESSASSSAPTKTSLPPSEPVQPPLVIEPKRGETAPGKTSGTADTRSINDKLADGMKQKGWKPADLKAFYKEHVDEKGIGNLADLNAMQKQVTWDAMIKHAGVIPF